MLWEWIRDGAANAGRRENVAWVSVARLTGTAHYIAQVSVARLTGTALTYRCIDAHVPWLGKASSNQAHVVDTDRST